MVGNKEESVKILLIMLLAALQPAATSKGESPFVCNIGALTAADRARKEEISRCCAS